MEWLGVISSVWENKHTFILDWCVSLSSEEEKEEDELIAETKQDSEEEEEEQLNRTLAEMKAQEVAELKR